MIRVLFAGLYSSIQDMGRYGFRKIGVPVSGVMDRQSACLGNALLNNNLECATIEMTYQGMSLAFEKPALIAVTGAIGSIEVDQQPQHHSGVIAVESGSILTIGRFSQGARAYLAIEGGFDCPSVLGSRSDYVGITASGRIAKNDQLFFFRTNANVVNRASVKADSEHLHNCELDVFAGPEFSTLSSAVKHHLMKKKLRVCSSSNRMAYGLSFTVGTEKNGGVVAEEIISSAVQPGTVQMTPSGQLMVLMRDGQTTGGYARVLQLSQCSIDRLAQKRPDQEVIFNLIDH